MTDKSKLGTAVVTGASHGIGEVYAERLAQRGYDIVLVARGRERLEENASRLAAQTGRNVEVLSADLSQAQGRAAVEHRLRHDETVSLLVNNAGIAAGGALASANLDDVEQMLEINVTALTRLAGAAAAGFVERKGGAIVNIASAMAYIPVATASAYAATKAFVVHFSKGLNEELSPHGVRVQAVLPGYTRTPLLDNMASPVPAEMVMPVGDLVDAALAGFDQGETVTIPSLPDVADWKAFEAARAKLVPNLSRDRPAERYKSARSAV